MACALIVDGQAASVSSQVIWLLIQPSFVTRLKDLCSRLGAIYLASDVRLLLA